MRLAFEFTDRGGPVLSSEHSFSDDFLVMLGCMLAHKDSATDLEGLQPGITPLMGKDKTPVPFSEFELNLVEVRTGETVAIGRRVQPFKVDLHMDALPGVIVETFAYGHDLCAQAVPMFKDDARNWCSLQLSDSASCRSTRNDSASVEKACVLADTLTRRAKARANVAIDDVRKESLRLRILRSSTRHRLPSGVLLCVSKREQSSRSQLESSSCLGSPVNSSRRLTSFGEPMVWVSRWCRDSLVRLTLGNWTKGLSEPDFWPRFQTGCDLVEWCSKVYSLRPHELLCTRRAESVSQ